jgi:hypothetical protein
MECRMAVVIRASPGRIWALLTDGAGLPRWNSTVTRDAVEFSMVEVFSGVMLSLIKGSLPDFAPAFEQYAADLKREAERATP